ncbi:uncharacterized protein CELE_C50B8.6 [Caenorhabditis elegans]|uniref:Uncharacterized protein n=1 Tax=Caenorhabditis elegans TaxID=6239 RepID=Q7YX43_CAEEL|nr:Uncharacterized protein CELE_C50B8.6 [Caenorhabditis elegans]CAE17774.1 Uncharacterized protein CELE_C50B8.6 [Caenorhabditis elegans]|eukprot:NP_001023720.1 Uncharacterized protein CELE_C50B8.6 [Caenorhabditis elegans]
MSVDQTITELSGTLSQLSTLVAHINGQISGITGRVNQTLDNFDQAVANLAKDAGSLTYQVGNTVQQVPNAWIFYFIFITLIVVFILLSILILLSVVTKAQVIYSFMKGGSDDSSKRMLVEKTRRSTADFGPQRMRTSMRHVQIPMETEPRRPGFRRETNSTVSVTGENNNVRPYQRRPDESGKYAMEQQTSSSSSRPYSTRLEV